MKSAVPDCIGGLGGTSETHQIKHLPARLVPPRSLKVNTNFPECPAKGGE